MFTRNIQMMFSLKDIVLNLIYSERFVQLGNQQHYATTKITFTLRSFKVSFLSKFLTTYILKTMHKRNMYCWSFNGPEPGGPESSMRE